MKACTAYLRTALVAVVALTAAFQAAEAQFPFGPGGGGSDCVGMGRQLQNSCAAVQGQLTQNAQQILGATCMQLATAVQKQSSSAQCALHKVTDALLGGAPRVSLASILRCCSDTRSFVTAGCTCDQNLLSLAPLGGVSPDAIRAVGKVAQVSSCASDAMDGAISNPCIAPADDCSAYRPH